MSDFATAALIILPPGGADRRNQRGTPPPSIPVQFNPTSLRLQRSGSQQRSGMLRKNQQVQFPSTQAATLSFDLEFDTAEEFTGGQDQVPARHVDVRSRSGPIFRLTEPAGADPAGAPPRVEFSWGSFSFQGMVTQVSEEFDYFGRDGTPLRSKMSVTMEEQDPRHAAAARGPGARTDADAAQPGGAPVRPGAPVGLQPAPGASPGRAGTAAPTETVAAREGESVQQMATRLGADPSAWRSMMNDLTTPVGLAAGTPVQIGPELDVPAVIGQEVGFSAGVAESAVDGLAAALGLGASGPAAAALGLAAPGPAAAPVFSGAASPAEAAGFALAAAGGIGAASRTVLAERAGAAVRAERSAFAVPARTTVEADDRLDPRSLAYGRGVPLRSRVNGQTSAQAAAGGSRSLTARARPAELPVADARAVRPWERLPPAAAGRAAADLAQRGRDARPITMRWRPGGGCR